MSLLESVSAEVVLQKVCAFRRPQRERNVFEGNRSPAALSKSHEFAPREGIAMCYAARNRGDQVLERHIQPDQAGPRC